MSNNNGKEFTVNIDGKDSALYMSRPNQRELFQIDLAYRQAMTELLKAGVMTRFKAAKLFEDEGTWTKEDERELENLSGRIVHNTTVFNDAKEDNNHEDNMKMVTRIAELRGKQLGLINRKNLLFENAAERQAEEQKMHAFARLCCKRKDIDQPLFESDKQYQKFVSTNVEAASKIFAETYTYEYNIDVDKISMDWPEVQYVQSYDEKQKQKKQEEEEAKTAKKVARKSKKAVKAKV